MVDKFKRTWPKIIEELPPLATNVHLQWTIRGGNDLMHISSVHFTFWLSAKAPFGKASNDSIFSNAFMFVYYSHELFLSFFSHSLTGFSPMREGEKKSCQHFFFEKQSSEKLLG